MTTYKLASIYPLKMEAVRPRFIPTKVYMLQSVPRDGKPFILTVEDQYEDNRDPMTNTNKRITISASDVANDLLRTWTTEIPGCAPDAHPGIWIVREIASSSQDEFGRVRELEAARSQKDIWFDEDLKRARDAQTKFFEAQVVRGDKLADDPKTRPMVTPLMKESAKWLLRDREWLDELRDGDIKRCPYCTKGIPVQAIVCPECHNVVDFDRHAELEARKTAAINAKLPKFPMTPAATPART